MTHDQDTESTATDRAEHPFSVSRRRLLQYTAAGLVGFIGTSQTVNATDHLTDAGIGDLGSPDVFGTDTLVQVKGTGTGVNAYQITTIDITITTEQITAQQGIDETVIEGTVRKGNVDAYYVTGWITDVRVQGSVTYSVHE